MIVGYHRDNSPFHWTKVQPTDLFAYLTTVTEPVAQIKSRATGVLELHKGATICRILESELPRYTATILYSKGSN